MNHPSTLLPARVLPAPWTVLRAPPRRRGQQPGTLPGASRFSV